MGLMQREVLKHGGYTWSLISHQVNANAHPEIFNSTHPRACISQLKKACREDSPYQQPYLFGLQVNNSHLINLKNDLAFFLLARGPYAWLGWGTWGMTWPFNAEPAHGELPPLPHGVPRPPELEKDYGVPIDKVCRELYPGVFERRWTKSRIRMDCYKGLAEIDTDYRVSEIEE
eukprot:Pgem_evm1s5597